MANSDYEIHEGCGYENARCACKKNVVNPVFDPELVAALNRQVREAIDVRKQAILD